MPAYLPRVVDEEFVRRLETIGAVLIEGPKACGKTATATQVAKTVFRLDEDEAARIAVRLAPERLFDNPTPILFDEWQAEPDIWNRVRRQVDDRQGRGLYILTDSATPNEDADRHSGAGRFGVITMRPMSLFESGHSTGEVSLGSLFAGEAPTADGTRLSFEDLVRRIVIGGWPELLDADENDARDWLSDYLTQIAEIDVQTLGPRRNSRNARRLLASLAAWRPHMRSRARLRTGPVRYFIDPSLGPAGLNIGSADLLADPQALGFHFEALAIRDLRVYAKPLRGVVDSWRDSNGNEVDAIITTRDGWGAFEIKLNPAAVDDAAAALRRFAAAVDTTFHGDPKILGVITSTGYAGRRDDGVHVIPITTLGP